MEGNFRRRTCLQRTGEGERGSGSLGGVRAPSSFVLFLFVEWPCFYVSAQNGMKAAHNQAPLLKAF
jgi:hypothetical protein